MPLEQVTHIFVTVDDFCKLIEQHPHICLPPTSSHPKARKRKTSLSNSEIITIMICFHHSGFRTFKGFYTNHVQPYWSDLFPGLVSYNRFIELSQRCGLLLMLFVKIHGLGQCNGISFIDSTVLRVCHSKRIKAHKVFKGIATTSRSTMGWYHGFKLHLVINDQGEILDFYVSKSIVDDRNIELIKAMSSTLFGYLVGDKGYISKQLTALLSQNGIHLLTPVRRNMKQKALSNEERILIRKRSLIETVNDELKNICQIEHTRHRSVNGFLLNVLAGLAAYSFLPKKPSLRPFVEETDEILQIEFKNQLFLAA